MRKQLIVLLLLAFVLVSSSFVMAADQVVLDFAIHTAPQTEAHLAAIRFKELVEDRSNGSIKVNLFPGAALGGEKDNIEQLKTGQVALAIFGDILPSLLAPEVSPTVIPFIYPNVEEVYAAWEGELGDLMKEKIMERGNMMVVGLQRRGARHLTANKLVKSPEDLKGLKLRVPEIPTWVTLWKAVGAQPTPVAWPEVYSALQTGVVDGQENPYSNIYAAKLYEVQDYVMETGHLQNVFHWALSLPVYKKLTPYQQQIVLTSAKEAAEYGDKLALEMLSDFKAKVKAEGMEIIEVDTSLFRAKAKPVIEEMAKNDWDPKVWEYIKKYFE
jgi:tripartite ATP-independent transporter DctP family solute receptor